MVSISTDATGSTRFFAILPLSFLFTTRTVCSYFLMHTLLSSTTQALFCLNIHTQRQQVIASRPGLYFAPLCDERENAAVCVCILIRGVVSLWRPRASLFTKRDAAPMQPLRMRTQFKCPRLTRKCFNDACEMAISDVSFQKISWTAGWSCTAAI